MLDADGNEIPEKSAEQIAAEEKTASDKKAAENQAAIEKVVEEKLGKVLQPGQAQSEIDKQVDAVAKETGFSPTQVKGLAQMVGKAMAQAVAPIHEVTGKEIARAALGDYNTAELMAQVEEEMKSQPPEVRGNPKAWESVAYLVIGKNAKKLSQTPQGEQRVITGGGPISSPSGAGTGNTRTGRTYSAEEQHDRKVLADRYFGGDLKKMDEYSKKGRQTQDGPKDGNSADRALQRLTGGKNG